MNELLNPEQSNTSQSKPAHTEHLDEFTLNEFLDELLPSIQKRQIEAHLTLCAECSAKLNQLRLLFATLDTLPEIAPQRDLAASVVQRIAHLSRPHPALPWATMLAQLAVAMLALITTWSLVVTTLSRVALPAWAPTVPGVPSLTWSALLSTAQRWWTQLVTTAQQTSISWTSTWLDVTQTIVIPEFSFSVWGGLLLTSGLCWLLTHYWYLFHSIENPPVNHSGEAK